MAKETRLLLLSVIVHNSLLAFTLSEYKVGWNHNDLKTVQSFRNGIFYFSTEKTFVFSCVRRSGDTLFSGSKQNKETLN